MLDAHAAADSNATVDEDLCQGDSRKSVCGCGVPCTYTCADSDGTPDRAGTACVEFLIVSSSPISAAMFSFRLAATTGFTGTKWALAEAPYARYRWPMARKSI